VIDARAIGDVSKRVGWWAGERVSEWLNGGGGGGGGGSRDKEKNRGIEGRGAV
jgi:hypothetical protein